MPTTVNLRKILDRKSWEFCAPAPGTTSTGHFISSSRHFRQQQLLVSSVSVHYIYLPEEDAWIQIPSGALGGTFGAGSCGTASAIGPTGTATGGAASTINTNLALARDLRGYKIHLTGGPGAGDIRTISSNTTTGSNDSITVDSPFSATPTTGTTYRLLTPRWYIWNAGTMSATSFRVYDYATNTWTSLSVTSAPTTWGTDGRLIATPSITDSTFVSFASGTSTGSNTGTTLNDSTKTWTTNQFTNYQVRIVSGTGAGQVRTISSNTATALTVPTWTTTPSSDSVYTIEGNDDFLYLMGNNAVTLFRYSISGNSWTTLSPVAARAAAPGVGMSGQWVWGVSDSAWTNESAIINGRRIYSFRGAATTTLDYYDIAANTWVSNVNYSPRTETFTTGSKYIYTGNFIYIQKEGTGRWFRYDIVKSEMDPWSTMLYPQGGAVVGDTAWDVVYKDGATELTYIHMVLNSSTINLRCLVF